MTGTADRRGDAARDEALSLLGLVKQEDRPIRFWWRDDDAVTVSPQLDRLLDLARRHNVPVALAVVPILATEELADRLAQEPNVSVLQHGWRHVSHSPVGEKKSELGGHRPPRVVLAELRSGRDRLAALMPQRFRPVLVPPWNRIAGEVATARHDVGLPGLSLYGEKAKVDPQLVNTHVDLTVWKPRRRPMTRTEAYAALAREIGGRLAGDPEPIGLLTHHLVHDDASWSLLEGLLNDLADHPAAEWQAADDLFGAGAHR